MIFIDTSFFVSLFLDNDPNYPRATKLYPHIENDTIISDDILKETLTIVSQRKGKLAAIKAHEELLNDHRLLSVTTARFQAGLDFFLDSKLQKDISLIDCITVAICKELKIKRILSFNRHFKNFGLVTL